MTLATDNNKIDTRNYGIDLLRIVSMLMVTVLHFSAFGGMRDGNNKYVSFYLISLFIVISFCAVNVFAMISGYVMYGSKIKYYHLLRLWFQVAFYSVGLSFAEKIITNGTHHIIGSFFPVMTTQFWYFSAYFFMFFFIPFFNEITQRLSKKVLLSFVGIGFIVLCLFSNIEKFIGNEVFGLYNGYSVIWLSFCYMTGAVIKKYQSLFLGLSKSRYIIISIVCVILTYTNAIVLFDFSLPVELKLAPREFLLNYTSPTVFIQSICLLILFSQTKIVKAKKLIKIFAPASFGVYLIQTHPFIWNNYLTKFSTFFNNPTAAEKIGLVLGFSVAFYLAASLVDFLRIQLFRLLHIDLLSKKICELLGKPIGKIKSIIEKTI